MDSRILLIENDAAFAGYLARKLEAEGYQASLAGRGDEGLARATQAFPLLVGSSGAMQSLFKDIGRAAATTMTVLIRGETGTGKELVARAIHAHSRRAAQPFVAINCAAIPETLMEGELFGHERGAYTGAEGRRIGRFEQARRGTAFLDEIGDLSPSTQVKLLRVLQKEKVSVNDNVIFPY
jgi:DNA-binding NtrC family response regulator